MSSRNQKKPPPASSVVKHNKQQKRICVEKDNDTNESGKAIKDKTDDTHTNNLLPINIVNNDDAIEIEIDEKQCSPFIISPTDDNAFNLKKRNLSLLDSRIPKKNLQKEFDDNASNDHKSLLSTPTIENNLEKEFDDNTCNDSKCSSNNITAKRSNIVENPYIKKGIYSPPKVVNITNNNDCDQTVITANSPAVPNGVISMQNFGINPFEMENIPFVDTRPKALIRCAYIETDETQTVIFWFHEQETGSYRCQVALNHLIASKTNWVMNIIPFSCRYNDPSIILYFCQNNQKVLGKNGKFGMRLYHYTVKKPFQTLEQMKITAYEIKRRINEICHTAQLVIDEKNFFYFNQSCVWSSLANLNDCLYKLKKETSDCFNDNNSINYYFWEKHKKIIRKYFFPGRLNVDLANMFNAPLNELDPRIERTEELLTMINYRLSNIHRNEIDKTLYKCNIDPMQSINYAVIQPNNIKDTNITNTNVLINTSNANTKQMSINNNDIRNNELCINSSNSTVNADPDDIFNNSELLKIYEAEIQHNDAIYNDAIIHNDAIIIEKNEITNSVMDTNEKITAKNCNDNDEQKL